MMRINKVKKSQSLGISINQNVEDIPPECQALESIEIDVGAKDTLDHIKQAQNLPTYSEAIESSALYKKSSPSIVGAFPGTGTFEREEGDPSRVPKGHDIE